MTTPIEALRGLVAQYERQDRAVSVTCKEWENARAALASHDAQPAAEPVQEPWRDHVEQRLLTWRQRFMNKSGDQLALDDLMGKESLDDLIDFVCDEWAQPAAEPARERFTAYDQKGTPGHCHVAQVFAPDGSAYANIDSTPDPAVASERARRIAAALNAAQLAAEPTGEAIRLEGYSCAKCGCVDMVKNDASSQPADGYDKERHAQEWRALESGEAKP